MYDTDGRFTLFPYWEEKLKEIFPTNTTTAYNTLIFTGAIGLGKSTIAVICQLYMLYRLLCLKDPYLFYGLQPIDKITISLMNITIENAKGVALDKMNQMILSSEWFMKHGTMTGTTNLLFVPEKHIELITASSNNQVIGRAVFCLDGDTIIKTVDGEFSLKELEDKTTKVYSIDDCGNMTLSNECKVEPTILTDEEYQIELEDGSIIKCTPNHRFMLKDGSYKEAKDLTENDELFDVVPFGYIYKFTNIITNKIYIGKREKTSFDVSYYGSGKEWKKDLLKYGKENIKREVICYGFNRKELNELEKYYIKLFNSKDKNIGYNIHKGGQGGNSLGDTKKWSKLHKGERNGRYNKEVSQETREKISIANKGKKRTQEFKDNLSKTTKGIKKPEGFGNKISQALKGKAKSELCLLHLREANKKTALKNKGKVIYNNGVKEIRLHPSDEIPVGFTKGRIKNNLKSNLPKDYHWYNNGEETIYCKDCPEGFKPGRKIK